MERIPIKATIATLWKKAGTIDRTLLLFLVLFLNVKLLVKVVAVVLVYMLRPAFSFGFSLKNSRLPLFYIFIIGIAVFNYGVYGLAGNPRYGLVFLTGTCFWLLCILAINQVRFAITIHTPAVIQRTLLVFFVINVVISLSTYMAIIIETRHINPYRYQGNYQQYFIGTGDYIKGITLDTSSTNAMLNAFGILYFLSRKNNVMVLLCMLVLLLTGSNITNLLLCGTLLYVFIFQSTRDQKSMILICFAMLLVFLIKVSPQNTDYITNAWDKMWGIPIAKNGPAKTTVRITERPDSTLNTEERKEKIARLYLDSMSNALSNTATAVPAEKKLLPKPRLEKPVIPTDSIHTPAFQHKSDSTVVEKELVALAKQSPAEMELTATKNVPFKLPGKLEAFVQTYRYMQQYPLYIFTGLGMGNFSSKLAFKVTALKISGSYPQRLAYINDAFRRNHLDLYGYYFTSKDDYHSVVNSPASTYDQLLSEYGIAGIAAFAFFYIGFFVQRIHRRSYALPLVLLMLGAFFIEYWFEQLSVVVVFELLLLLNDKENTVINR